MDYFATATTSGKSHWPIRFVEFVADSLFKKGKESKLLQAIKKCYDA